MNLQKIYNSDPSSVENYLLGLYFLQNVGKLPLSQNFIASSVLFFKYFLKFIKVEPKIIFCNFGCFFF